MSRRWTDPASLLALGLALVLAGYCAASYPEELVATIMVGSVLVSAAAVAIRWLWSREVRSPPDALGLLVLAVSAMLTLQSLVAREMFGWRLAIDMTPGYPAVALLIHLTVVLCVVYGGSQRSRLVGLGAGATYSSLFYAGTFATPEAGPPFVALTALAIALLVSAPPGSTLRRCGTPLRLLLPMGLFARVALLASVSSSSAYDGLAWWLRLVTLLLLLLAAPRSIETAGDWLVVAALLVALSVGLPALLAAAKLVDLAWRLGTGPATDYKMALNELGKANLIARSLVVGLPLLAALAKTAQRRSVRLTLWSLFALGFLVFATTRSWVAATALVTALAFAFLDRYGELLLMRWEAIRSKSNRVLTASAALLLILLGIVAGLGIASRANVGSFNGRFFQYRAALREIAQRPVLGFGPGHYYLKSQYTKGLNWLVDTQETLDDPLEPLYHLRDSTTMHAHNLFLEIGVGTGLAGLAAFVWLLVELLRSAGRARAQSPSPERVLLTGCLAGLVASVGYGLVDVMEISPPFFTFPTWALAGLLLAAPLAFRPQGAAQTSDSCRATASRLPSSARHSKAGKLLGVLLAAQALMLVIAGVLLPLLGNRAYREAFGAYRERDWGTTVSQLVRASRWEPLQAKYHQLRGEALINLGRCDEAIQAYERAEGLKRGFAPYLSQLGWLLWLQGDLDGAIVLFRQAVAQDAREAWRSGLHADLGLAYVAQGRSAEAFPLFAETLERDPEMALAPYWLPYRDANGEYEVVLDPVYLPCSDESKGALAQRILAHLGKADHTPRLFDPVEGEDSLPTLDQVLDVVEGHYEDEWAAGSREAPGLLATVAEASKLAGLLRRSEEAYVTFQEELPTSAYGYLGLADLYRGQGRLAEAKEALEQAVVTSPRDPASWHALSELLLDRVMWEKAEGALLTLSKLEPLDARQFALLAALHQARGELAQAAADLRSSLVVEESVSARLKLAGLYRDLSSPAEALEQCTLVIESLLQEPLRPFDPLLRGAALCVVSSTGDEMPVEITDSVDVNPVAGNVLLGHVHRVQGRLEDALRAYQAAAAAGPCEGGPHYFLGETFQAMGQPQAAEAEYRKAAELDPLESLPLLALGQLQSGQGQSEAALRTFRAAVGATPGWAPARVALGNALLAAGDREAAAWQYGQAADADGGLNDGLVYDFVAHLAEAEIASPAPGYVSNDIFTIDGRSQRVLYMHPDSRVRYRLELPDNRGRSEPGGGKLALAFDIAVEPGSWQQPGDGVAFAVHVESGGVARQVFRAYMDPKHTEADRGWHSYRVDLSAFAGQGVTVVFETGTGPAGDLRFDWAGWGTPRLMETRTAN